jgi:hypothetical protein
MDVIIVGMQFCGTTPVALVKDLLKSTDKPVYLDVSLEKNPSGLNGAAGLNGSALGVHYSGAKIGYIRNKDLPILFGEEYHFSTQKFRLTMTQDYFWVAKLEPKEVATAKSSEALTSVRTYPFTKIFIDGKEVPDESLKRPFSATKYIPEPTQNNCNKLEKEPAMNSNPAMNSKPAMSSNSIRNSIFREVVGVVLDISSGKLGIKTTDGISTYTGGRISTNPVTEMGFDIPAFAMRVPVTDLVEGDIIVNNEDTHFFQAHTDNGYTIVTCNGEVRNIGGVTNMFFGENTVLAVKNMFGNLGSSKKNKGMNPMMMAMMMGSNSNSKFDMKTFAMMSMMGGGKMDSNAMMMLMMMGK